MLNWFIPVWLILKYFFPYLLSCVQTEHDSLALGSWSRQCKQRKVEAIIVSITKTILENLPGCSKLSLQSIEMEAKKKKKKKNCAPGLCINAILAITPCTLHSHLTPDGGLSETITCFDLFLLFLLNAAILEQPGTKCFVLMQQFTDVYSTSIF